MSLPSRTYKVVHVGILNKARLDPCFDNYSEEGSDLYVVCDAIDVEEPQWEDIKAIKESLNGETTLNLPYGVIIDLKDKIMFPVDLQASDYFVEGDYIHIQNDGLLFYNRRVYPRGLAFDTTLH